MRLWERCELVVPQNDPRAGLGRKRAFRPDLLLVGEFEGALVASVTVGYEGHRGWVNDLAVDPGIRGHGLGRVLMQEAERRLVALGCLKLDL